eukprot:Clim_evm3s33 gene=Clim_evmTU3s33
MDFLGMFKKAKQDSKFKKAGSGVRLGDSNTPSQPVGKGSQQKNQSYGSGKVGGSSSGGGSGSKPARPPTASATSAQNAAREAALARLEQQEEKKKFKTINEHGGYTTKTMAAKMRAEAGLDDKGKSISQKQQDPMQVEQTQSGQSLTSSSSAGPRLQFTCPLTGVKGVEAEVVATTRATHASLLVEQGNVVEGSAYAITSLPNTRFAQAWNGGAGNASEDGAVESGGISNDMLRTLQETLKREESQAERCLRTLLAYATNILKNPNEEKYCKVRQGNKAFQERVAPVDGSEQIMQAMGFTMMDLDGEEVFVYNAEMVREVVGHDPASLPALQAKIADGSLTTEAAVAEMERVLLSPSEAPEPMLDRETHEETIPPEARGASAMAWRPPAEFFVRDRSDIRSEVEARRAEAEKEKELRTRAMREAELNKRRKVYRFVRIRVRFPPRGRLVVGNFRATEPVSAVREWVTALCETEKLGGVTLRAPRGITLPTEADEREAQRKVEEKAEDAADAWSAVTLEGAGLAPAATLDLMVVLPDGQSKPQSEREYLNDEGLKVLPPQ